MKTDETKQPTFDAAHHRAKTGDLTEVLKKHPHQRVEFALEDYTDAVTAAEADPSKDNIKQVARFFDALRGQAQKQADSGVTVYLEAIPLRVGGGGGVSERTVKRNAMVEAMREAYDNGTMTASEVITNLYDARFGIRANNDGEYKPLTDYITSILTTIAEAQLKAEEAKDDAEEVVAEE
jgi:hypothetical protein